MPVEAAAGPAALEAVDVHRHFGGLHAVDGMSLVVPHGTLLGLIGPNGAGKSTLFHVLSGFLPPKGGQVRLQGADVTRLPMHRRARLGLVRTWQLTRPLARLTVLENLLLASGAQAGERAWAALVEIDRVAHEERSAVAKAREALAFFELAHLADAYAGVLSGGQRKLLELARALMADPKVMLLDEPVAGVNPKLARKILDKINLLRRDRGITFVVIEHDLETVFRYCDPIVVMAHGRKLAQGPADAIRADRAVVDAYLGGAA